MMKCLPSSLTREADLMVLCARTQTDAVTAARIRHVAQGRVDWELVAALAKWHGVVPLVYRNLMGLCSHAMPGRVAEDLRRYVQASALLNRILTRELTNLLAAFKAQGLLTMPVKGPTLAVCAYGDLTLREFDDLDLIVAQDQIAQATEILEQCGYRTTSASAEGQDPRDGIFHLFRHQRNPVFRVDLQWLMAGEFFGFRLDRKAFWERRRTVMLEGEPVTAISPEDLLIILGVHGSKHAWAELKWTCDVAELVRATSRMDWAYVEQTAKAMGSWRLVLMGLAMAHHLVDVPLPDTIRDAIAEDPDLQDLVGRMPETLLADRARGVTEADAAAFYFVLKDSWWQRWRFGLQLCHADSRVVQTAPNWVRQGRTLRALARLLSPIHRAAVTLLPTGRMRRTILRWLYDPV